MGTYYCQICGRKMERTGRFTLYCAKCDYTLCDYDLEYKDKEYNEKHPSNSNPKEDTAED